MKGPLDPQLQLQFSERSSWLELQSPRRSFPAPMEYQKSHVRKNIMTEHIQSRATRIPFFSFHTLASRAASSRA